MEQLLEVACIALRTVVDKHLVETEAHAARGEVVLQNSFAQEVVALLRAVAPETVGGGHLVDGLVHGLDHGRAERLCDVANAERDDVGLRVHHLEDIDLLGNVSEQVVVLQIQEVDVY